ncbi:MAG: hypothetical protein DCC68_05220 [Planctomycetota bacterium]|nr:MAG: hypothetical protein DCC68_05220 [Planctomycetota bacterium]
MKLPAKELDLQSALAEFDVWITPSLGEIRDTDKFLDELGRVVNVFDAMEEATGGFENIDHCDPKTIANTFIGIVDKMGNADCLSMLDSLASVLFLVTGKSDNNAKCQLPIHMRDVAKWDTFPIVKKGGLAKVALPRELKAEKLMKAVVALRKFPEQQKLLLGEFCSFILSDERYAAQLWSIGKSYVILKQFQREKDLLTPLVVFKIRGSVSASGGHDPEDLLRERLTEWGLRSGVDFNVGDIIIGNNAAASRRSKTRAYDFVLPFQTRGWKPRILVQCQFYAGDSGSVSHKNVDQTSSSRAYVGGFIEKPRFVEYLDGAGYFSSLNGDLQNLLSMENTGSFFQIRSAPIRLRRELQAVGFLCPLDLEHAILRASGNLTATTEILRGEGYDEGEIARCIEDCLQSGVIDKGTDGELQLNSKRREFVRRYFLLDVVARFGSSPKANGKLSGSLLIPGYGPFFGMKFDDMIVKALELAPSLRSAWQDPQVVLGDIRALCDDGVAMS